MRRVRAVAQVQESTGSLEEVAGCQMTTAVARTQTVHVQQSLDCKTRIDQPVAD